jgi:hypothetical protein
VALEATGVNWAGDAAALRKAPPAHMHCCADLHVHGRAGPVANNGVRNRAVSTRLICGTMLVTPLRSVGPAYNIQGEIYRKEAREPDPFIHL